MKIIGTHFYCLAVLLPFQESPTVCVVCVFWALSVFVYFGNKKGFKGGRWRKGKREVSYGKNEGNQMEKTLDIFKGLDKRKLIETAKIGE